MSKPIPGTHLYPLTFMGFPLIDSSTIKLSTAAPSSPSLGSVGMGLTPLPVSGIPGGAASSQLLLGEIPDQGCSTLPSIPLLEHQAGWGWRPWLDPARFPCENPSSASVFHSQLLFLLAEVNFTLR